MTDGGMGGRSARGEFSAEAYRTIFDNASDGLFIHPPDSDAILAVNNRLTDLLGYSRAELLDMTVTDFTADDWEPSVTPEERIQQAREEGQVTFEWRNQRKDGTAFWVEVSLTVVTLDGAERVLASVRDIDDRKQHQRRARAIFDQTYQFTGLMEPDGTLIEANQTALEFGGLDREDVIGTPVWDCYWFEYDPEVQEAAKTAVARAADGEFVRQNLEVRGSDGTEIIDFSIRPVTDDDGAVSLLIPEGRVITTQVAQQERLAAYNRVMRHNIRNQVTTINGYAAEIKRATDDPQLAEHADVVLRSGQRLERISEQMRELDELREGDQRTTEIALADLLTEVATEHESDDAATAIEVDVEPGLTVESSPQLLRVAVENLVENAVEHGGSTVHVTARTGSDRATDDVEITVRDDGPGIDPAEYEPVLQGTSDPLEHATSIGLLIVKWSVDDLGGELQFDSEPDGGTAAKLRLPPLSGG